MLTLANPLPCASWVIVMPLAVSVNEARSASDVMNEVAA